MPSVSLEKDSLTYVTLKITHVSAKYLRRDAGIVPSHTYPSDIFLKMFSSEWYHQYQTLFWPQ